MRHAYKDFLLIFIGWHKLFTLSISRMRPHALPEASWEASSDHEKACAKNQVLCNLHGLLHGELGVYEVIRTKNRAGV